MKRLSDAGFVPVQERIAPYSLSAENSALYFGKSTKVYNTDQHKTGFFFVIPEDSAQALQDFTLLLAENLRTMQPEMPVSLIFTSNDVSKLPEVYRENMPAGIRYCADSMKDYNQSFVILLQVPDTETKKLLRNSADGITIAVGTKSADANSSMSASLQAIATLTGDFEDAGLPVHFTAPTAESYYLGWCFKEPYLSEFVQRQIPAVAVYIGSEILSNQQLMQKTVQVLADTTHSNVATSGTGEDQHFLFIQPAGKWLFISELSIVNIVIGLSIMALFIIFMSPIFKKRRDLRERTSDLLHTWWLIPTYIGITFVALIAGKAVILRFFIMLTGNQSGWNYVPAKAIILQSMITIIVLSILPVIEQLVYFPYKSRIYGYMGNLAAFANLIIFMAVEFSLAPVLLVIYICSFIFYHCRRYATSVFWFAGMCIPLLYLFGRITPELFLEFISDELTSQQLIIFAEISLLTLPFELAIARLKALNGMMGKSEKFRIPITSCVAAVGMIVLLIYTAITPVFTQEHSQPITVGYIIRDSNAELAAFSPFNLPNLTITAKGKTYTATENGQTVFTVATEPPEPYYTVHCTRKLFLGRCVNTLTITATSPELYPPLRYEVNIVSKTGTAVYDASIPCTMTDSGTRCRFMPGESPDSVLSFDFSSDQNTPLTIQVTGLFTPLPDELTVATSVPSECSMIIEAITSITIGDNEP